MTTRNPLLRRRLTRILAVAAILPFLPYAWTPVYRFDATAPFTGAHLFNPYETVSGSWLRANLHAHSRAWSGLTNGRQTAEEVRRRYRELGYDVPGISDYQRITSPGGAATLPLYEHGFNIGKHHQLAIGARNVAWFDFPLWQSTSQQQYVIDRVGRTAELVALAHPDSRYAYSLANLRQLTGYQLMEVGNGPFASEDSWDAVLSSGHPVWGLANDDTHDLDDPRRTAAGWNMIDAGSGSVRDLIGALRAGRSYAVMRNGAIDAANVTTLTGVEVRNETMTVRCAGASSTISFIGQNGAVRHKVKDTTIAAYTFSTADTYVRAVIESPQTVLYLNPVVRFDGAALPAPAAAVSPIATWLLRGAIMVGLAVMALLVTWQRPAGADEVPDAVLTEAKRKTA